MTPVTWGDVTAAEFGARDIIRDPDAAERINAYHRRQFSAGSYPLNDEAPSVTEFGSGMLTALRSELAQAPNDVAVTRHVAHEFIAAFGVLTAVQA
jgi:hypothetical protein